METEIIYDDELPEMTLVQIRAARSFFGPESFATYLKSLSEDGTLASLLKAKCAMQPFLERSSQLSPTSNTSLESGPTIVEKNDFWEFLLPE